jgi:hypothetical protein
LRNIRRLVLAALLPLALLVVLAPPTQGRASCPDGAYCLFTKIKGQGKRLVVNKNALTNFSDSMNDKATSVINENNRPVFLYKGRNGHGGSVCITPHGGLNLGQPSGGFDNAVSSGAVLDEECL